MWSRKRKKQEEQQEEQEEEQEEEEGVDFGKHYTSWNNNFSSSSSAELAVTRPSLWWSVGLVIAVVEAVLLWILYNQNIVLQQDLELTGSALIQLEKDWNNHIEIYNRLSLFFRSPKAERT